MVLDVNNGGSLNETRVMVDQSITGRWQRVSLLFEEQSGDTYTGFEVEGANFPAYICCWQFEPGGTATSYIPTSTGAQTRDADILSNMLPGAGGYGSGAIEFSDLAMVSAQVTDDDMNATIAGVSPVATIAWTQISNKESMDRNIIYPGSIPLDTICCLSIVTQWWRLAI